MVPGAALLGVSGEAGSASACRGCVDYCGAVKRQLHAFAAAVVSGVGVPCPALAARVLAGYCVHVKVESSGLSESSHALNALGLRFSSSSMIQPRVIAVSGDVLRNSVVSHAFKSCSFVSLAMIAGDGAVSCFTVQHPFRLSRRRVPPGWLVIK